jgi:peptide/nickel transport system ATP-binding protein
MSLLEVTDLKKYFPCQRSFIENLLTRTKDYVHAVDGVSFSIEKGQIFTLAGESGCGKTTTGKLVLGLIPATSGSVTLDGVEVTKLRGEKLRRMRRKMQLVYQDPYASLSPRMRVGESIAEPLTVHGIASGAESRRMAVEMLEKVGLFPGEEIFKLHPHQLSGGQRQRVAIARAIILNPEFIVADEPVSMIDVSLRASILELMLKLREEFSLTYLFITHDLAIAKYISDTIAIMYLGKIVEMGSKREVFNNPRHPYTKALLSAIPVPDPARKGSRIQLSGEIPNAINPPTGCRFHTRCSLASEECRFKEPALVQLSKDHAVACCSP